ncbi:DUF4231 domain-containing protein [Nocardia pneumoniae]|uniref:DUF4231 domain-containing protein n=1 Tax=Nocardia pneumoniae TaxID=228601 RepID=UPI0002E1627B|nr:DUF4231 domain-containing protein [Nocardia pneumoniae]
MADSRRTVAEWAWQRQSVWSKTADNLKSGPHRARQWRLVSTVLGAGLALSGSQLGPVDEAAAVTAAVAGAALMAAVGVLRGGSSVQAIRQWTRARSVSEAIKSEVFLFLTSAGVYVGEDRERRLDAEVQRLEREVGDLRRYSDGVAATVRPLPAVDDVDSYLRLRVRESQLERYYVPRAQLMRRRVRTFKAIEVTLALVAAALAAVAAVSPNVGAWASVATTAAGTVAAHAAAERYETLWIEYSRTAAELRRLADQRTAADGRPLSPAELIVACENVISVQNQAWMAKWGEENSAD